MSGVGWFFLRIALQADDQRATDSKRQPLPGVEGVARPVPAFDSAQRRTADPHYLGELFLGQPATLPGGPNLASQPGYLFEVASMGLGGELGAPELRHVRCMVAPRTWPSLMPP